ncbi:type 1 fimbrial protein [Salmonella enterica]|uniref:Type 1 fimbrial protein n=1 Tax=Salmonella enterica subsp. houtenae serovar 45:g,z51:- TaxID=1967611 RepID=A0A753EKC2_SALHO|nr:type 1 fimbrial protein [Salmonella enterica]HAF7989868.1 type 1 fimbrial protein [Salmonella enterica subsp. houtenae serovar 45:g,z51:-]
MKIKNCLFLLGTAMAVMSSSAFADTTGTQTFTANITANTCTVDNLNKTVDLGSVFSSDFTSAFGSKVSNKFIDTGFQITGCPATITTVKVTPTFVTPSSDGAKYGFVENTGTFDAVFATNVTSANDVDDNQKWLPGTEKSFTVTNGDASVPVQGKLYLGKNGRGSSSAGTLNYAMSFTFDFA